MALIVESRFASNIRERPVTVVAKKNVVSPKATEEIVPPVVVVVADTYAGLPAGARQPGFLGDVSKRSITVVLIQMRCGSLAMSR